MRYLITIFFFITLLTQLQAAGPVINEVLYDPISGDGGSSATTCEAVEIAATPGTDLSCYVITDGEYVIVIPNGTITPTDGFFVIGSSGCVGGEYTIANIDLDLASCGCLSSSFSMVNTGEYIGLFDPTGAFIDGVGYESPSAGNTPDGIASEAVTAPVGCSNPATVILPIPANFDFIATNSGNGVSITRDPNLTGGLVLSTASTVGGNNSIGTTNDGNPIPPAAANPNVPTLSEWGLINLALLLMTFGTLSIIQIKTRSEV